MNHINTIGYACGIGAADAGTAASPIILQGSEYLNGLDLFWSNILYARDSQMQLAALAAVIEINQRLAQMVYESVKDQQQFLVLGGDQTCSIGTWSGARAALPSKKTLGLIWIDAHMDSHTPESSHTKNLHGMALASLLGHGDKQLTELFDPQVKLKPEQVILIGVRSYEDEEKVLLQKLGVKIYFMDEVQTKGIDVVMQAALKQLKNCDYLGLSLDIDAIDPADAPATGYQIAGGISGSDLVKALKKFSRLPNFIGMECVEFNPNLDDDQRTEKLIGDLLKSVFQHE